MTAPRNDHSRLKSTLAQTEPSTHDSTLAEARQKIRAWQDDYNHHRPHSGLGNMTPAEFMARKELEMRAA
jgi:transposase InsO family protein